VTPPTIRPTCSFWVRAASAISATLPSSIQFSIGPTPGIWLRWSITQIDSKPERSAVVAMSVSLS
jgi:hypothetical protein